MKKPGITVAMVSAVALFAALPISGQQIQPQPPPTRLALEVVSRKDSPPGYTPVPGPESNFDGAWFFRFGRMASWQPPPSSFPVRSVRVVSRIESKGVRVIVSVLRGARFSDSEDFVADYIARESEKTSIETLKQFGIEPFQITLVRVTPSIPSPPSISTQTKSIEVVSVEAADATLPGYVLVLRNTSTKNMKAFAFRIRAGGKEIMQAQLQNPEGQPVIEASSMARTEPLGGRSALLTPVGYQPHAPPNSEILITAAVFDDNSFEGETAAASMIIARDQGRKVQLERIVPILRLAARSEEVNPNDSLSMLRERVSALTDDVSAPILVKLTNDFPTMGQPALQSSIEAGARLVKNQVLTETTAFQRTRTQPLDRRAYWKWLSSMLEKYEGWLSRLQ